MGYNKTMNRYLAYPWSLLFGFYYYVLFQFIYLLRFGSFNTRVSYLDAFLVAVGIISVLIFMFFAKKLIRKRGLLLIPFVLAVPFSAFGALGGGLLGFLGILIFGLVPFFAIPPLGYWIIKRFVEPRAPSVEI